MADTPKLTVPPHLRLRPDHIEVWDEVVLAKDYFALVERLENCVAALGVRTAERDELRALKSPSATRTTIIEECINRLGKQYADDERFGADAEAYNAGVGYCIGALRAMLAAAPVAATGAQEAVAEVCAGDAGMKVLRWKDIGREWADFPIGTKLYAAPRPVASAPEERAIPGHSATRWQIDADGNMVTLFFNTVENMEEFLKRLRMNSGT